MLSHRRIFQIGLVSSLLLWIGGCGGCFGDRAGQQERAVQHEEVVAKPGEEPWWGGPAEKWEANTGDDLGLWVEADPESGNAPLSVKFTIKAIMEDDLDAVNARYAWDFGDGSPISHDKEPTHTYQKPGTYRVVAKAIDGANRLGNDDVEIDVLSAD